MEKFRELQGVVNATERDAEAFYLKGNKTAGVRLRKAMQVLKGLAVGVRKEVTQVKGAVQN
ncbi:MAG: histone H1 [Bacteroidota bacterium]